MLYARPNAKTISMKTLNLFVFLIIATLFTACDKKNDGNPLDFQLGQPFELAFGDTADCACDMLSVTFADVLEDSRCPSDAVCFWEGRAIVQLKVDRADGQSTVELTSRAGHEELARDTLDGLVFELLEVSPYPVTTTPIEEDDYRIELLVVEL